MSEKHYLLTGCAGFIGAKTSEMLLEMGCRVTGIDNLNDYYDVQIKNYRLEALKKHPNLIITPSFSQKGA